MGNTTFWEFVQNVLTEALAGGVLILIAYLIYRIFVFCPRRKFLRFFGIDKTREIDIVVSNLWDECIKTNWQKDDQWGEIVAGYELRAANSLSGFFSTSASPPLIIQAILEKIWLGKKIHQVVKVCQKDATGYDALPRSLILIGSGLKNCVRRHFLPQEGHDRNNGRHFTVMYEGEPAIELETRNTKNPLNRKILKYTGGHITGKETFPKESVEPAIIERMVVETENRQKIVIISCSGRTGKETELAARYLENNWDDIEKNCRKRDNFAVTLWFDQGDVVKKLHHPSA